VGERAGGGGEGGGVRVRPRTGRLCALRGRLAMLTRMTSGSNTPDQKRGEA
jgi:hypothetical protein